MTIVNTLLLPQVNRLQMTMDNLLGVRDVELPIILEEQRLGVQLKQRQDIVPALSITIRSQNGACWCLLEDPAIGVLLGPEQDASVYPDDFLFTLLEVQLQPLLNTLLPALDLDTGTLEFSREIPDIIEGPVLNASIRNDSLSGACTFYLSSSLARKLTNFLEQRPYRAANLPGQLPVRAEFCLGRQQLRLSDLHGLRPGDILTLAPDTDINRPILRIPGYGICQTEINNRTLTVVTTMTSEDTFYTEPTDEPTHLSALELTVNFQLGSLQLTLEEVAALQEGSTFDLGPLHDAPVSVKVNNQTIARCELVDIEGHLGARIVRLIGQPAVSVEIDDE